MITTAIIGHKQKPKVVRQTEQIPAEPFPDLCYRLERRGGVLPSKYELIRSSTYGDILTYWRKYEADLDYTIAPQRWERGFMSNALNTYKDISSVDSKWDYYCKFPLIPAPERTPEQKDIVEGINKIINRIETRISSAAADRQPD